LNIDVETPYDDSSASVPPFESSNDFTKDKTDVKNLKVLLKEKFFAPILKCESDFNKVWTAIDPDKLVSAVTSIVEALQKYFCDRGNANRSKLVTSDDNVGTIEPETLPLKDGITSKDFPVLKHFCIPLESFWISGLMRDILKLSKNVNGRNLLKFKQYNDCEVCLVSIPNSVSYYHFKRNMKENSWFQEALGDLSDSPDISLSWLLASLTKLRNEEFIVAAEAAGLLLNGKTMDAESSTAEEANKNFRQQRIILRHLACYFG